MKIGVTSQNFRTVTGHGGRARRYLVYEPDAAGEPQEVERISLPKELSFHEFHAGGPHPVDAMDVVITASAGQGFVRRLAARGVRVLVTGETDPREAAAAVLKGRPLPPALPEDHEAHQHDHNHEYGCCHGGAQSHSCK